MPATLSITPPPWALPTISVVAGVPRAPARTQSPGKESHQSTRNLALISSAYLSTIVSQGSQRSSTQGAPLLQRSTSSRSAWKLKSRGCAVSRNMMLPMSVSRTRGVRPCHRSSLTPETEWKLLATLPWCVMTSDPWPQRKYKASRDSREDHQKPSLRPAQHANTVSNLMRSRHLVSTSISRPHVHEPCGRPAVVDELIEQYLARRQAHDDRGRRRCRCRRISLSTNNTYRVDVR